MTPTGIHHVTAVTAEPSGRHGVAPTVLADVRPCPPGSGAAADEGPEGMC